MKKSISIGIIMLMLAAGFVIVSYDRADVGIKILNEDDYKLGEIKSRIYFEGMPSTYEQYQQKQLDNKIKVIANNNGVVIG